MVDIVNLAIAEDIGTGDISASLLKNKSVTAEVICRDNAIIFGIDYFNRCWQNTIINWLVNDGSKVTKNTVICQIQGSNREIVSKERVALNFLQTLSATATHTHKLVKKIQHTKAKILDTRKTIPGLRVAQKQAVLCGGGVNNRSGLYDIIMLKENHISQMSIAEATKIARAKYPHKDIIIEVENLSQLAEADTLKVHRILCDNFNLTNLKKAVKLSSTPLEVSGNIDENNIVAYAETGVNFISLGTITKNIKAIDLSINIK